jgi:hypothetical protein
MGLALYWAEGGKRNRRVEICNSDPRMIQIFIAWLSKLFGVDTKDLTCTVGINEGHFYREGVIKTYWSELTGVPLDQFRKTSFKRVQRQKSYENFDQHYGTLTVRVNRSTKLSYEILGLIDGLCQSSMNNLFHGNNSGKILNAWQRSSVVERNPHKV